LGHAFHKSGFSETFFDFFAGAFPSAKRKKPGTKRLPGFIMFTPCIYSSDLNAANDLREPYNAPAISRVINPLPMGAPPPTGVFPEPGALPPLG
jgi:hypothetical protein